MLHHMSETPNALNEATARVLAGVVRRTNIPTATLAADIGVARESVSRYLNGRREIPASLLLAVCRHSGISATEIMSDIERELARGTIVTGEVEQVYEKTKSKKRPS